MKTRHCALAILLCAGFASGAYGQNKIELSRWDAGLSGGAVLYEDVAGFDAALETRAYLLRLPIDLDLFAGGGFFYQYTGGDEHALQVFDAFVLAGCDWFLLADAAPDFKPLALRAQLALGGGYTSDTNSAGTAAGSAGFLVHPAIGADYGFGRIHAHLLLGYEMTGFGGAFLAAPTISIGGAYTIMERSAE